MKLEPGVRIHGIKPEIVLALAILNDLWPLGNVMEVTSLVDGRHSRGSLHYVGFAFDLRTRDLEPEELAVIASEAKDRLGQDFDVVVEKTHLHIEFQPKEPY